ncbi:AAA family ATPase [Xanthomonas euvesicatoria]|uniref:AAA family ATPase n=1 Tax=Xanthomonas citri TaxID=346 RepID=UPI002ED7548E|nr:AAA family ATPase [Xanthomonas euvesicatoria]
MTPQHEAGSVAYLWCVVQSFLRAWFISDNTKALLRGIKLIKGSIRGINSLDIEFHYPIAAFAGVNGAGKSTILALASCAFHNNPGGYKLKKGKQIITHLKTSSYNTRTKLRRTVLR